MQWDGNGHGREAGVLGSKSTAAEVLLGDGTGTLVWSAQEGVHVRVC